MKSEPARPDSGATRLRAGFRTDPIGLPHRDLLLSWWPDPAAEGPVEIAVHAEADGEVVWRTAIDGTRAVVPAQALRPGRGYRWSVGAAAAARFEIAPEPEWFDARWIAAPSAGVVRESHDPIPLFRGVFDLAEVPHAARLSATALGLYRVWVNGRELTDDALFRPGWTDYRQRVHAQTYDCADLLRPGRNVIAATVARGWYAGRLGLIRQRGFYGRRPAWWAQLDALDAQGGRTALIGTDDQWLTTTGSIVASDLLRGETVDYRLDPTGWPDGDIDAEAWRAVELFDAGGIAIDPQPHDAIRRLREFTGELVHEHARGPVVFDFGQNLVGWTRLQSRLLDDTEVIVRHGEILTPDQLVYRDNLRGAFQEDRYADHADGVRTLEPSFVSHGFRYAEVWGLPSDDEVDGYGAYRLPADTTITAVAVDNGNDRVGGFTSAVEPLDRFVEAIAWTVRDNFLEAMTDCPQRDERHGWLGDAGVIAPTAAYLFDIAAFASKFVHDAADAQTDDGAVPSWVPVIPPAEFRPGAPGWADGYVRLLALLTERYGDTVTAERHYGSLVAFLDHLDRHNPDGLRVNAVGADFSDWLSLPESDGQTYHPGYAYTQAFSTSPKPVVATAHSYRTFVQAAQIASRLGRAEDAARFTDRAEEIRRAYLSAFVRSDGTYADATQTVYAQAIGFGLVTGAAAQTAADHLAAHIRQRGYVTTGIHGVQHVLGALGRHGHLDLAIDLLLREEMPSWLYMVQQGATTVWEKWDGIKPDGSLATAEMNSFNHCALGAVGAYLFEDLLGLRLDGAVWGGPVVVAPSYHERLPWVDGHHDSPVGPWRSRWEWDGAAVVHDLAVPAGCRAEVRAPAGFGFIGGDAGAAPQSAIALTGGSHRLVAHRVGPR